MSFYRNLATLFLVALVLFLAGVHVGQRLQATHDQIVDELDAVDAANNTARIVMTDKQMPRLVVDLDLDHKTCECWEPQAKRSGK